MLQTGEIFLYFFLSLEFCTCNNILNADIKGIVFFFLMQFKKKWLQLQPLPPLIKLRVFNLISTPTPKMTQNWPRLPIAVPASCSGDWLAINPVFIPTPTRVHPAIGSPLPTDPEHENWFIKKTKKQNMYSWIIKNIITNVMVHFALNGPCV